MPVTTHSFKIFFRHIFKKKNKKFNPYNDIEAEKKRKEEAEKRKRLEAIPEYWDSEYY